jgi:hypothetical protein
MDTIRCIYDPEIVVYGILLWNYRKYSTSYQKNSEKEVLCFFSIWLSPYIFGQWKSDLLIWAIAYLDAYRWSSLTTLKMLMIRFGLCVVLFLWSKVLHLTQKKKKGKNVSNNLFILDIGWHETVLAVEVCEILSPNIYVHVHVHEGYHVHKSLSLFMEPVYSICCLLLLKRTF